MSFKRTHLLQTHINLESFCDFYNVHINSYGVCINPYDAPNRL